VAALAAACAFPGSSPSGADAGGAADSAVAIDASTTDASADGSAPFRFVDDFEGDLGAWTVVVAPDDEASVSTSFSNSGVQSLRFTTDDGGESFAFVRRTFPARRYVHIRYYFYFEEEPTTQWVVPINVRSDDGELWFGSAFYANRGMDIYNYVANASSGVSTVRLAPNTWHQVDVEVSGVVGDTRAELWLNGVFARRLNVPIARSFDSIEIGMPEDQVAADEREFFVDDVSFFAERPSDLP